MTEAAWLRRAAEHLFLCGLGDVAEQLCQANMTFGLAKLQYAEEHLGLPPAALFVGAPDATVTRNTERWRSGFGYGGQVRWHPSLAVLDSKPNGCGMLVGAPDAAPEERVVRDAARSARNASLTLDGVELRYDLGESNHFVDALELEEVLAPQLVDQLPAHLFIIHSSGHEHRATSPLGPGLYLDESEELRAAADVVQTPWGTVSLLRDAEARAFFAFCARVQAFNLERRKLYAGLLFGPHSVLCNATHQGLRAPGVFHLGAYWFEEASLYPLTLGPDQPVYLLRPRPNFSLAVIERLGWRERAERLGVLPLLCSANLLPHGGGYCFPDLQRLVTVEPRGGDRRVFVLERSSDGALVRVEDARALPFAFRDMAVLARLMELEMADPVARYRIRFVVQDRS
jgi:hypothetical protein